MAGPGHLARFHIYPAHGYARCIQTLNIRACSSEQTEIHIGLRPLAGRGIEEDYHVGSEELAHFQHLCLVVWRVRQADRLLVEYLFQTRPLDNRQALLLQLRDRRV